VREGRRVSRWGFTHVLTHCTARLHSAAQYALQSSSAGMISLLHLADHFGCTARRRQSVSLTATEPRSGHHIRPLRHSMTAGVPNA
jgi:hypothetical protein